MSYVNILHAFLAGRKSCAIFFARRKIVCIYVSHSFAQGVVKF